MSDLRIGLSIEHGEDRSYVIHKPTGRRYEIRSFDMKEKEFPLHYMQDFIHFKIPRQYDLYLGLVEVPEADDG